MRPVDAERATDAMAQVMSRRFAAQLLSGPPAADPIHVVGRLLAVQAQDPRGARLSIRARSAGMLAADVDRALSADRSLLVTWVNRGTLHLVRREDYSWLLAVTAPPQLTGNARRLAEEGVSIEQADRGVSIVEQALASDGPLTRYQLRERLASGGVPTEGQALIHLLFRASLQGLVVRGPVLGTPGAGTPAVGSPGVSRPGVGSPGVGSPGVGSPGVGSPGATGRGVSRPAATRPGVGGEQAFVLVRDWLGEQAPTDPDRALGELARRFLDGHGPATARDLARWAGIPLGQARQGFSSIGATVGQGPDGLAGLSGVPRSESPRARLLGPFDPMLLGWESRREVLGDNRGVVTTNGIFRPIALVGGRAVGIWRLDGGAVRLRPFESISEEEVGELGDDAVDVLRYLGLPAVSDPLVIEP